MYRNEHDANEALYRTAHAAGWDAGNRNMHAAGRTQWNAEDWDAAADTFAKVQRERANRRFSFD